MLPSGLLMSGGAHLDHVLFYPEDEAKKMKLLEMQKEYKMAALKAKKQGDLEQARLYLRTSKVCKTQAARSARTYSFRRCYFLIQTQPPRA